MATLHSLISSLVLSTTLLSFAILSSNVQAHKNGFSVNLIHRDSPKSPFYNPLATHAQRVTDSLRRSFSRAVANYYRMGMNPDDVKSVIHNARGEYLMRVQLGTPRSTILAIADTGSDLLWTQCQPCEQCYKQKGKIFNPKNSSTFETVSCGSAECQIVNERTCSSTNSICQYTASYGDGSSTSGDIVSDVISLTDSTGSTKEFDDFIFGCGYNNDGTFKEGSGIVGLGRGSESLINQLDSEIQGKFSYCLTPTSSNATSDDSSINFGELGIVSGDTVVSTPLVSGSVNTFYFLTLEGVSVGNKRLEFSDSSYGGSSGYDGNIIIDSGTTLTLFPQDFYTLFESTVSENMNLYPVQGPVNLCYESDSDDFEVPAVTIHFNGAHVNLGKENIFIRVDNNVVCFAFGATSSGSIYGNVAQGNFLVGYDTRAKTVSFKPTKCP